MKKRLLIAGPVAAVASLVLPGIAFGAEAVPILDTPEASINAMWVIVAGVLVMFMQAGFLLLEVGFSRAKNAGAGVAKILVNFSIASLCYWAVGFALAFGGLGSIAGDHGFFLNVGSSIEEAGKSIPFVETYSISPAAFMFFQFVFCAVSLAIVWGATLERIKFSAYIIYAVIFSSVLYPVLSHWIFGGGWLQVNVGMQDFAGSTVVHLIGATGAFAALLPVEMGVVLLAVLALMKLTWVQTLCALLFVWPALLVVILRAAERDAPWARRAGVLACVGFFLSSAHVPILWAGLHHGPGLLLTGVHLCGVLVMWGVGLDVLRHGDEFAAARVQGS